MKTKFDQPIRAKYKFQIPRFDNTFDTYWVDVDVIAETPKSYLLRVIVPFGFHECGDTLYAYKKNVRLPKEEVDTSEFWYNK